VRRSDLDWNENKVVGQPQGALVSKSMQRTATTNKFVSQVKGKQQSVAITTMIAKIK